MWKLALSYPWNVLKIRQTLSSADSKFCAVLLLIKLLIFEEVFAVLQHDTIHTHRLSDKQLQGVILVLRLLC
jgi:hypothetical protein